MHLLPKPLHCRQGRGRQAGGQAGRQAGRGAGRDSWLVGAGMAWQGCRESWLAAWGGQPGVAAIMFRGRKFGGRGSSCSCQQGLVRHRGGTGCEEVGVAAEAVRAPVLPGGPVQARRLTRGGTNAANEVGGCRRAPHLRHDGHWIDDAWRRALPPLPAWRHLQSSRAGQQGRQAGTRASALRSCAAMEGKPRQTEAQHKEPRAVRSGAQSPAQPPTPSKLSAGWLAGWSRPTPADPPPGRWNSQLLPSACHSTHLNVRAEGDCVVARSQRLPQPLLVINPAGGVGGRGRRGGRRAGRARGRRRRGGQHGKCRPLHGRGGGGGGGAGQGSLVSQAVGASGRGRRGGDTGGLSATFGRRWQGKLRLVCYVPFFQHWLAGWLAGWLPRWLAIRQAAHRNKLAVRNQR